MTRSACASTLHPWWPRMPRRSWPRMRRGQRWAASWRPMISLSGRIGTHSPRWSADWPNQGRSIRACRLGRWLRSVLGRRYGDDTSIHRHMACVGEEQRRGAAHDAA
eukprot:6171994-Pleurochrysis_carterae.AAC.1